LNPRVQFFEHLPRNPNPLGIAEEANLIAARAGIDAQVRFQDSQGAVTLAIELGGCVVVVEDERLAGSGVLVGQVGPRSRPAWGGPAQCSGARRTASFSRRS
jgi:hypothetical protein